MGHAQTDAELIAAFRGGDLSAREKMTERYYGLVVSYCNESAKKMPSHIWGDDLLSYGFEGLLRSINKWEVDGGRNFPSFLKMHVGFAIADGLREENKTREAKRHGVSFSQFSTEEDVPGESTRDGGAASVADDNPVDLEKEIFNEQIWRTVINKSRCGYDKQILNGYFRYGLTMKQIGEKMGLTESSISQDIKAALVEVRRRVNFKYGVRQRKNYPAVDVCLVPECQGKEHYANGLCYGHYKRFKKHKQIHLIGLVCAPNEVVEKCHWHGCDKPHANRHLCAEHLLEWKRDRGLLKKCNTAGCGELVGDDRPLCPTCWARESHKRRTSKPCKADQCHEKAYIGGYCYQHYQFTEGPRCSTEGCERRVRNKGLCELCYNRTMVQKRTEQPCQKKGCPHKSHRRKLCRQHYVEFLALSKGETAICSAGGCNELATCKGMCSHHYDKLRRSNKPMKACDVLGCEHTAVHRGLCNHHRMVLKPFINPLGVKTCAAEGCCNLSYCKGLCPKHYQRLRGQRELAEAA